MKYLIFLLFLYSCTITQNQIIDIQETEYFETIYLYNITC